MTSKAEVAVTGRDWKRVEAELDGLVPGGPAKERPADDESALLDHIADALRLDPGISEVAVAPHQSRPRYLDA